MAELVAAEGFFEPLGDDRGHDFGVYDHAWRVTVSEPLGDRAQVFGASDGRPVQPNRPTKRGEINVWKLDQVQRMAVWAEVVDLRPVGRIVVHHDQHPQAEPGDRFEV